MCLLLIAIEQHPQYPIIILSNRDEFYTRATFPAHYWKETPGLFAGQDLVSGGSWLGVNQQGQFAFVTNYRNPKAYDPSLLSRGLLVTDYLQDALQPEAYINLIRPMSDHYNLYNLIVGNLKEIMYYSNVEEQPIKLKSGIYGLSNHVLDTPWYKVSRAKKLLKSALDKGIKKNNPDQLKTLLFPILEDKRLAPDQRLPETGVGRDLEKALSSIFVSIPGYHYGTRNSSLLLFTKNEIYFYEKSMRPETIEFQKEKIDIDI